MGQANPTSRSTSPSATLSLCSPETEKVRNQGRLEEQRSRRGSGASKKAVPARQPQTCVVDPEAGNTHSQRSSYDSYPHLIQMLFSAQMSTPPRGQD